MVSKIIMYRITIVCDPNPLKSRVIGSFFCLFDKHTKIIKKYIKSKDINLYKLIQYAKKMNICFEILEFIEFINQIFLNNDIMKKKGET